MTDPTPAPLTPDPTTTPDPATTPDPTSSSSSDPASPADAFAALKSLTKEQRAELRAALDDADGGTGDTVTTEAEAAAVENAQTGDHWRQAVLADGVTKVLIGPPIELPDGTLVVNELPDGATLLPPTNTP